MPRISGRGSGLDSCLLRLSAGQLGDGRGSGWVLSFAVVARTPGPIFKVSPRIL
jgi:hypothetical protein